MHFRTLVTVDIPPIVEDEKLNQGIKDLIEKMEKEKNESVFFADYFLGTLKGKLTSFSRAVAHHVAEVMEPYSTDPEDPQYLDFADMTAELRADYEKKVCCLKLPEGRIVEKDSYPYYSKYIVINGKVYQKEAGRLHHAKRTKKAKKITVLHDYPRAKVYKSFEDYAGEYRGYPYNEKYQGYGYECNPNAMWDWYQIGGRWPAMFLVRNDCVEHSPGERSWCNEDSELKAPEGYIWVAAARKKDIHWDVMRDWMTKKATERFQHLQTMFAEGKLEEGFYAHIVEDGIVSWGDYDYRKDESLEEYLERCSIPKSWKYPFSVHDIVDADNWLENGDCYLDSESGKHLHLEWHDQMDEYIDDLDDETVLVGVDYHM